MKMKTSILVALAVVALAVTIRAQEQKTPPEGNTSFTEEAAYEQVNSFEPQSLQSFLKSYPSGKHAQDGKEALELLVSVQRIREGKTKADYVIPFENIGGVNGWAGPGKMGFTGYLIQKVQGGYTTSGIFWPPFDGGKTPGRNVVSFDGSGNPRVADTDGSIIAFNTGGVEFGYYGGV
jgi:hypothetical protein